MSRIVLSGYYGFHNLGDEAVLAATVQALRRLRPRVRITVLSASPEETRREHGVDSVPRAAPGAVLGAMRGADLVLCGGGSLFQDATSWRSPWYYLGVLSAGRRLALSTAVHAQGLEVPRRRAVAAGIARVLDRVDLITVRDRASLHVLADLGVRRPRTAVAADPSWLLTPHWSPAAAAERARWGKGRWCGLALRAWGSGTAARAAAEAARAASARLGVRWALFPMHPPGDFSVAQAAAAEIGGGAVVVRGGLGPSEVLALIGSVDVMVAMRLHALMFAASQGVPIVPLAYDPKVRALAAELGEPAPGELGSVRAPDLLAAIEAAADGGAARARLLAAVPPLRARASLAASLAAELLR